MMDLPNFLFSTRKAKVGMFMCSCPFCTGSTKALAGTTMAVVVSMMDTSTIDLDWGSPRGGCAFGLISSRVMVLCLLE